MNIMFAEVEKIELMEGKTLAELEEYKLFSFFCNKSLEFLLQRLEEFRF